MEVQLPSLAAVVLYLTWDSPASDPAPGLLFAEGQPQSVFPEGITAGGGALVVGNGSNDGVVFPTTLTPLPFPVPLPVPELAHGEGDASDAHVRVLLSMCGAVSSSGIYGPPLPPPQDAAGHTLVASRRTQAQEGVMLPIDPASGVAIGLITSSPAAASAVSAAGVASGACGRISVAQIPPLTQSKWYGSSAETATATAAAAAAAGAEKAVESAMPAVGAALASAISPTAAPATASGATTGACCPSDPSPTLSSPRAPIVILHLHVPLPVSPSAASAAVTAAARAATAVLARGCGLTSSSGGLTSGRVLLAVVASEAAVATEASEPPAVPTVSSVPTVSVPGCGGLSVPLPRQSFEADLLETSRSPHSHRCLRFEWAHPSSVRPALLPWRALTATSPRTTTGPEGAIGVGQFLSVIAAKLGRARKYGA